MPGLKISELPFQGAVQDSDLIVLVHNGETVHTNIYQLRLILGGGSGGPVPIIDSIDPMSQWVSSTLFPNVTGATNKYIITLNNSVTSYAFEAAVTVHDGEPHFVKYGMIGGELMHNIDFVEVSGDVVVRIDNNEAGPVMVKIQQL